MGPFWIAIPLVGALLGIAGLVWLAMGKTRSRRLLLAGLLILPILVDTVVMAILPSSKGGFWPWYLLSLMTLAGPMVGWLGLCGGAYWLSLRRPIAV